jgi:hypothetical protein
MSDPTPRLGDPFWTNVVLLLHLDGTEGSQIVVDSSSSNKARSTMNSSLTTTVAKFGTASLSCSPGLQLTYADHADWEFGSGQFTVECWARRTAAISGTQWLVAHNGSATINQSWGLGFNGTNFVFYYSATGNAGVYVSGAYTPTLNDWDYFAADRDASNVLRIYAGTPAGVSVIASATVPDSFFDTTQALAIGNDAGNTRGFPGQIDEVRITKGVARYAGTISAPTAPFPDGPVGTATVINTAGVARETLLTATATAQMAGIVREVLLYGSVTSVPQQYAVSVIT